MALADFKVFSWDIGFFSRISGLFLIECSKFVEIIGRFQGLFMACVLFFRRIHGSFHGIQGSFYGVWEVCRDSWQILRSFHSKCAFFHEMLCVLL